MTHDFLKFNYMKDATHDDVEFLFRVKEFLIDRDGIIIPAIMSHIHAIGKSKGMSYMQTQMSVPFPESPIHWLCEEHGFISIHSNDFLIVPTNLTEQQLDTIEICKTYKLINDYHIKILNDSI